MNPRLIAVAGQHRGKSFPITTESLSIGRDSTNGISVAGHSVSRKHCVITRTDSRFTIADLESKNGTSVNGIPIRERSLQEGDRIEVGESAFLFLTKDEEIAQSTVLEEGQSFIPTTRLRLEDVLYLEPERLLTSVPLTARIARGLDAMLKLSRSIQSVHDSETLCERMWQCVFSITPAQRASLIRLQGESAEIDSIQTVDRELRAQPQTISRSIVERVLQEEAAFLSNDLDQVVVTDSPATSLIVVPMKWMGKIRGVLHLDTGDSGIPFDDDHLQLASAVAAIGAVSFAGLRYLEKLQDDRSRLMEDLRITHSMVGESKAMQEVYALIGKVASVDSTVLIQGESGTGKELAARAIHLNGPRCDQPFVAINCSNLSEALLESELFGYEKGAFTGAYALKKGKLEVADGGTLFLDEIAEMAPALQARFLRVLQEREFERVGGIRSIKVDIRLIAATNRDLPAAVKEGKFRDDLFYRLNVVQVKMPPLRHRKDDIPLLASYFVATYAGKSGRKIHGISEQARRCLMEYPWPGNVRELQNCIERAVVLGSEEVILPEDLPEAVLENASLEPPVAQYQELLRDAKRKMIQDALQQANGNHADAAALLGMHPNNLRRILKNLGLRD